MWEEQPRFSRLFTIAVLWTPSTWWHLFVCFCFRGRLVYEENRFLYCTVWRGKDSTCSQFRPYNHTHAFFYLKFSTVETVDSPVLQLEISAAFLTMRVQNFFVPIRLKLCFYILLVLAVFVLILMVYVMDILEVRICFLCIYIRQDMGMGHIHMQIKMSLCVLPSCVYVPRSVQWESCYV